MTHFDSVAPELSEIWLQTDDGPVLILCFDTSASPFVVKNSVFGNPGAGSVEREVPWREGTSTRSATRNDLIKLIAPLQKTPDIQLLYARVSLKKEEARIESYGEEVPEIQKLPYLSWYVYFELYIQPMTSSPVVLPVHQTELRLWLDDTLLEGYEVERKRLSAPYVFIAGGQGHYDSVSIENTASEAVVRLPGRLHFEQHFYEQHRELPEISKVKLSLTLLPCYATIAARVECVLQKINPMYCDMEWQFLRR